MHTVVYAMRAETWVRRRNRLVGWMFYGKHGEILGFVESNLSDIDNAIVWEVAKRQGWDHIVFLMGVEVTNTCFNQMASNPLRF